MLHTKMTGEPAVFDSDYVNDTWETNLTENENNDCINDEQIITINFEGMLNNTSFIKTFTFGN